MTKRSAWGVLFFVLREGETPLRTSIGRRPLSIPSPLSPFFSPLSFDISIIVFLFENVPCFTPKGPPPMSSRGNFVSPNFFFPPSNPPPLQEL